MRSVRQILPTCGIDTIVAGAMVPNCTVKSTIPKYGMSYSILDTVGNGTGPNTKFYRNPMTTIKPYTMITE